MSTSRSLKGRLHRTRCNRRKKKHPTMSGVFGFLINRCGRRVPQRMTYTKIGTPCPWYAFQPRTVRVLLSAHCRRILANTSLWSSVQIDSMLNVLCQSTFLRVAQFFCRPSLWCARIFLFLLRRRVLPQNIGRSQIFFLHYPRRQAHCGSREFFLKFVVLARL